MSKSANRILNISLALAVFAAAAYFVLRLSSGAVGEGSYIPPEFLEARTRGAVFAENIVSLNRESLINLERIGEEDKAGRYSAGVDLITQEISRNEIIRQAAIGLSNELIIMAEELENVRPEEAVHIGLQAILSQNQVVQRLLNYNSHALELLAVLRSRFENRGTTGAEEVGTLLEKMNEDSLAINDLNEKYIELMAEFDELTTK